MTTVIGIRFRDNGKVYYFNPGALNLKIGDAVIAETLRGQEYGEVVTDILEVNETILDSPLKPVIRIANDNDSVHEAENRNKEKTAFGIALECIARHNLPMKLVNCTYTFDNSKILFYFVSDKRVDFRMLVKDLAGIFHTRIELRQIGVRDEAKMLGGLGMCGRPLCCSSFLKEFQPVSIKMAKEQNLSLNPTKISGNCGRLMCCLKYEEDHYEDAHRRLPRVGKEVITPDGPGVVVELNILKESIKVRMPKGDDFEIKEYSCSNVKFQQNNTNINKNNSNNAPHLTEKEDSQSITNEMINELSNEDDIDLENASKEVLDFINGN